MLNVAKNPFMLSIIMLNVVMPSVVAPLNPIVGIHHLTVKMNNKMITYK